MGGLVACVAQNNKFAFVVIPYLSTFYVPFMMYVEGGFGITTTLTQKVGRLKHLKAFFLPQRMFVLFKEIHHTPRKPANNVFRMFDSCQRFAAGCLIVLS